MPLSDARVGFSNQRLFTWWLTLGPALLRGSFSRKVLTTVTEGVPKKVDTTKVLDQVP